MANIANDYSAIFKILVNDNVLKDLMLIPETDKTNYSKLRNTYFIESYSSDIITTSAVCRLLIHPAPQSLTNNPLVREDSVIIEIFVPSRFDQMPEFQRRILQIAGRIIKLLHRQRVNDKLLTLAGHNELFSSTEDYRRYYVRFNYKRVYVS